MAKAADISKVPASERVRQLNDSLRITDVVAEHSGLRPPWPKLCPLPDHPHDSDSSPAFKVFGNAWYCHSCGRGGGPVRFVALMRGLTDTEAAALLDDGLAPAVPEWTEPEAEVLPDYVWLAQQMQRVLACTTDRLAVLAAAWGVSVQTLERWQVAWSVRDRRWWLPVVDEDGLLVDIRRRSENAKPKVISTRPFGQGGHLFGAVRLAGDGCVVIVGGEKDVIVGDHHLGVEYTFVSSTLGEANWRETMTAPLVGRRVAVFLDSDATGLRGTRVVLDSLRPVVLELRAVRWTEEARGVGKDIADLCKAGRMDLARGLIRQAKVVVRSPV